MRNGKKSHAELTPVSSDFGEEGSTKLNKKNARKSKTNASSDLGEEALVRHVAELIRRGRVKPGKAGPPLEEILKPGPPAPSALKALRWARKS